jgi:exodeoxyribonuclease V
MTATRTLFADGIEYSWDQQHALDAIYGWRASYPGRSRQYFTMGGYAGTGKTTIISSLLHVWRNAAVIAPTGKAVNRLKQVGIEGAQTIHSLIYAPWEDDDGKIQFSQRPSIGNYETLICDEASMVNRHVFNDLLNYSKPILFVGDHGQLEPIGQNPNLMHEPDVRLEKIHRQAENNPIIRLASAWREGRERHVFNAVANKGQWQDASGRCVVTRRRDFDAYAKTDHQIICGYNTTRHKINALVRQNRGYDGDMPSVGEQLICLQNNKSFGVFNGQQAIVTGVWKPRKGHIDIELELDDGQIVTAPCLVRQFGTNSISDHKDKGVALFDFAYCISCHKSQGSEWEGVVVLEELASSWDPKRWRYTATTRAKERLVYCV